MSINISWIENYSFSNLNMLENLTYRTINYRFFSNRTFAGPSSIEWLDLRQNPIKKIDSNSFLEFKLCCNPNEEELDYVLSLKQMLISEIDDNTFNGLHSFSYCIDLGSNPIKFIQRNSFHGLFILEN